MKIFISVYQKDGKKSNTSENSLFLKNTKNIHRKKTKYFLYYGQLFSRKNMNISPILNALTQHKNLTKDETTALFTEIFSGNFSQEEVEKILKNLAEKGETVAEISAAASVMQNFSIPVSVAEETFDVCGTGGSGNAKTFNLSTTVAFVMATGGVTTAKHGNRKASSQSGSADLLEELGIEISLSPEKMQENLEKKKMSFLFAQVLHPAMKYVMSARKNLGIRTIFNFMGPLTNPSSPTAQLVGVSKKEMVKPMAEILKNLGKKAAMVVYGEDGLDEITLTGKTFFASFSQKNPEISEGEISPEDFGFSCAPHSEISGGTPAQNAKIITGVFSGKINDAKKDIVLLNAGFAFFVAGKTSTPEDGILLAKEIIDSGKAMKLLESFQKK